VKTFVAAAGSSFTPHDLQILQFTPTLLSTFDDTKKAETQSLFAEIFTTDFKAAAIAAAAAVVVLLGCYENAWVRLPLKKKPKPQV
jgi:hypothetical protein